MAEINVLTSDKVVEEPVEQERINTQLIPPKSIKQRNLGDNSVGTSQIQDDAVGTSQLIEPITLTAPTITSPTITGTVGGSAIYTKPTLNASVQALTTDTDGTTVTFDLSASNVHSVTLAGNRTLAVSNGSVGQCFIIRLIQDATGTRTVTWFTTIKWVGGSAPTLTTTINKTDTLGFIITSAANYDGYLVGQNL